MGEGSLRCSLYYVEVVLAELVHICTKQIYIYLYFMYIYYYIVKRNVLNLTFDLRLK